MKRANVLGAALVAIGGLAGAAPASAQTIGADASLFSSYVWRGLSLTNKPVLQPDVYVTFPAGNASITVGGWANIDLGKYDDPDDDFSESGGLSAFNFAEFDPWIEVELPGGREDDADGRRHGVHLPERRRADLGRRTPSSSTARPRSTSR